MLLQSGVQTEGSLLVAQHLHGARLPVILERPVGVIVFAERFSSCLAVGPRIICRQLARLQKAAPSENDSRQEY